MKFVLFKKVKSVLNVVILLIHLFIVYTFYSFIYVYIDVCVKYMLN